MKAVIFDFDGTIADNFSHVHEIIAKLAPKYGFDPKIANEVVGLRGLSMSDIVKKYNISRFNLLRMLLDSRKEMRQHLPNCKTPEGLGELIKELVDSGVRVAIISSNSRLAIREFLVANEIKSPIDVATSFHLFGKSKPIRSYMRKHALSEKDVVYVGDEVRDVDAAKGAGIPIVSVSWGYNTPEILRKNNNIVVSNVLELRSEIMKRFK